MKAYTWELIGPGVAALPEGTVTRFEFDAADELIVFLKAEGRCEDPAVEQHWRDVIYRSQQGQLELDV